MLEVHRNYYGQKGDYSLCQSALVLGLGTLEESSRLIPAIVRAGLEQRYRQLLDRQIP